MSIIGEIYDHCIRSTIGKDTQKHNRLVPIYDPKPANTVILYVIRPEKNINN